MPLSIGKIKELCQKYNLTPSKKFGQNYLLSAKPVKKMIEVLKINKKDIVVEVGPGFGILTEPLAQKVKQVLAFEIEKKLQDYWQEKNKIYKNIKIIWGDFLKHANELPKGDYKVAANLPYQVTAKLLRAFLESDHPPCAMAVMVQKEVGERIVAKGGKQSLLSISVSYYAEPKIVLNVAKTSFYPSPKVDSVVLYLKFKKKIKHSEAKKFFNVVKVGFSHPRKMLVKNLSAIADRDKLMDIFAKLSISANVRAEELDLPQWQKLASHLSSL